MSFIQVAETLISFDLEKDGEGNATLKNTHKAQNLNDYYRRYRMLIIACASSVRNLAD